MADSLVARPIPGVTLVAPEPLAAEDIQEVHAPRVRRGREDRRAARAGGVERPELGPGLWTAVCASNGGAVAAARFAFCPTAQRRQPVERSAPRAPRPRWRVLHVQRTRAGDTRRARCRRETRSHPGSRRPLRRRHLQSGQQLGGGRPGRCRSQLAWTTTRPSDRRSSLDIVRRADDYLPKLRARLAGVEDIHFDVLIYNAGMDPHEHCGIGGLPGMTKELLAERERTVFGWAHRRRVGVAFVLAGGYEGGALARADLIDLHRLTIEEAAGGHGLLTPLSSPRGHPLRPSPPTSRLPPRPEEPSAGPTAVRGPTATSRRIRRSPAVDSPRGTRLSP